MNGNTRAKCPTLWQDLHFALAERHWGNLVTFLRSTPEAAAGGCGDRAWRCICASVLFIFFFYLGAYVQGCTALTETLSFAGIILACWAADSICVAITTALSSIRSGSSRSLSLMLGPVTCWISWSRIISSVLSSNPHIEARSLKQPHTVLVAWGACTRFLEACLSNATFTFGSKCLSKAETAVAQSSLVSLKG